MKEHTICLAKYYSVSKQVTYAVTLDGCAAYPATTDRERALSQVERLLSQFKDNVHVDAFNTVDSPVYSGTVWNGGQGNKFDCVRLTNVL